MYIDNKVVVITGASKGLGRALAHAFANKGARLVLNARDQKELEPVAKESNALAVVGDVSKESDIVHLAQTALENYHQIDIWINNAGVWIPHASIEATDWQRVHQMMEVNLFGTIYGSKAALIQMRKQGQGAIVNVLSTSALTGRPGSSGYCASKYAATGFTKSLRLEAVDTPIKVIAIYPGGMQTNFFDERKPQDLSKYMKPSEVADKIIANLEQDNPEEELIIKRLET